MEIDPWSAVKNISTTLTGVDPKIAQLEAAKKALKLLQSTGNSNPLIDLSIAASEGDNEKLLEILKNKETYEYLNKEDDSGLYPITYAIVFDNEEAVEIILAKSAENLNKPDAMFGYTPLMWAVWLQHKGIVVELLNHGANLEAEGKNGITVFDLVKPGSEMYDFFEEHGLLENKNKSNEDSEDMFYKAAAIPSAEKEDELYDNIRLKTAGLNITDDTNLYQDSNAFTAGTAATTANALFDDEFNFNKLQKNQYIIFSDFDIPSILDLIFELEKKHAHKTTYPAAVIYQCVRYADHSKKSDLLVENFLNLAFTRIRASTASKSGVTSIQSQGDIVLQSYWLSVINFLYYYLCRDDGFFKRYPRLLQDLVITYQSLIIELTNSIKFRLNDLIDDCLLNFVNIPVINGTLYKNDWNFFKKKSQQKSTFDDIYKMLYPPSVKEQLKPSPIKITQTLGALLYVLELHDVHPLITQQTFSSVFYWLSITLFNRVLSQKKYLSRAQAIQIRLNVSVIEDWTRSNNKSPSLPDIDTYLLKAFPYTLIEENITEEHPLVLNKVAFYNGNVKDPNDLAFYHTSLFSILKIHFEVFYELLQWLQTFTILRDEDSLLAIFESLQSLNAAQLMRTIDKYRYEVDEEKFPKTLSKKIQSKVKNEDQKRPNILYQGNDFLYLNPSQDFPVALPTIPELVNEYGAGLGGIDKAKAIKYQPFLPYEIIDSIDEIHEQKAKQKQKQEEDEANERKNEEYNDEEQDDDDDDEEREKERDRNGNNNNNEEGFGNDRHDELFQSLQVPSSLAHRNWGVDDENTMNPW
ncbi:Dilute domain-containing protein [Wickerhamomyces ciferrii]|uniref:Dilute domain-containing protein n=1 Tax=Wickerhamomyces ciferrii (strain ATCC 14091 / BCRC 22168 / CBS 111 / JCM 3599 / NBRC 0793 / NRRL Y-1031 F-60-10) TaxID=1206466 RepID=K0KLA6_WICCF|nr:Dilute domain-containing protein [Wickerhamomyces ciferrii]CCH46035.1 Dilute domain-containing protein [Wickerhamomyces ciferrii]